MGEGFFFVVSVFDEEADFFFDGVCPVCVGVYVVEEVVSCGLAVFVVLDFAVLVVVVEFGVECEVFWCAVVDCCGLYVLGVVCHGSFLFVLVYQSFCVWCVLGGVYYMGWGCLFLTVFWLGFGVFLGCSRFFVLFVFLGTGVLLFVLGC